MSLQTELARAKAEVSTLESEIAAMPAAILGKTEAELSIIYHAIADFFGGHEAVPPVDKAPEAAGIYKAPEWPTDLPTAA